MDKRKLLLAILLFLENQYKIIAKICILLNTLIGNETQLKPYLIVTQPYEQGLQSLRHTNERFGNW